MYRYQVNWTTYEAYRLAIGATIQGYQHKEKAEKVTARYSVGQIIEAHYNPAKPNQAVLEFTSTAGGNLILIAALLVVFAVALFGGLTWFSNQ